MEKHQYGWVLSSDQPEHKDFDLTWFRRSSDHFSLIEFCADGTKIWQEGVEQTFWELEFTERNTDSEYLSWRDGDSFEKFESGEVCFLEGDDGYLWTVMLVVPKHTGWFFKGRNWELPSEALTEASCASAHRWKGGAPLATMPPRVTVSDGLVRSIEFSTGIRVWENMPLGTWRPFVRPHGISASRWIDPEKAVAAGALWEANEKALAIWEPLLLAEGADAPSEDDWWKIHF